MKYVLSNNLLTMLSGNTMYLSNEEEGLFIKTTKNINEAKIFNSLSEISFYLKEKKLKQKDYTIIELV